MALHFGFSKVSDYQRVTTNPLKPDEWHPVADALVWLSMICGFNRIDEKNVDKIAARIVQYQLATGEAYLRRSNGDDQPWQPVYITPADVRRFIGMWTNATPMSEAQWSRHVTKILVDTAKHCRAATKEPSALSVIGEYDPSKEAPAQPVGG